MAKRTPNWVRKNQAAKSKEAYLDVKITDNGKADKPIKQKKKKPTESSAPISNSPKLSNFLGDVVAINSVDIRNNQMDNNAHAIVVTDKMFFDLIYDHEDLIKELVRNTRNEELRNSLRRLSRVNVERVAVQIRDKFIDILEYHLRRVPEKFRVNKYSINSSEGSGVIFLVQRGRKYNSTKSIFSNLQKSVFVNVRRDVALEATQGTTPFSGILAITIVGVNIYSGDEIPRDLGNIAKSQIATRAPLNDQGQPIAGTGFQAGHLRGPGTVAADRLLRLVETLNNGTVEFQKFREEVQRRVDLIHSFDAELELNDIAYNIIKKDLTGRARVSIIGIEQAAKNSYSGTKAGVEARKLRDYIRQNAAMFFIGTASASIANLILRDAIDTFLGHKTKTRKINKRISSKGNKVRGNTKASSLVPESRKNNKTLAQAKRIVQEESEGSDLQGLIYLINNRLHDKIQENMGKGGSKQILNYRTGRFAKSAKVQNLYDTPAKNAIGAQVKYMRHPYGVFEPGGRLHKPGRDPHRIFGRSIRQILQEEKIANFRRVIVELE